MQLPPPPLPPVVSDVVDLLIAYILAVPIGWNREREDRSAGIRTFPIVAIASCALTLIAMGLRGSTPDAASRIMQGLVTGIGFIGGGAILKDRGTVSGTATAASVWNIGIVGASVGLHMYHVAFVLTVANFLTLKFLIPLKEIGPERKPGPRDEP